MGDTSPESWQRIGVREYSEKRVFGALTGFLSSEAVSYPRKEKKRLRGAKNGFFCQRVALHPVGSPSSIREKGGVKWGKIGGVKWGKLTEQEEPTP